MRGLPWWKGRSVPRHRNTARVQRPGAPEGGGGSALVTTGPAGRGCRRSPLRFPDKAVNLTTTPTSLSSRRETGFSASPSSQRGPVGGAWVSPPAPTRLLVTPPWRGPGKLRSCCTDRAPAEAGFRRGKGPGTGRRPADPRLRPEIQTRVRTSPRPARLRTWSILCGMRTVAGSQDTVSTAALLENVPTKALLPNPRQPSTQPRAGYRGPGVVHSPGPLWVLKSLPRNPRPARVSAGFQGLSVDAVLSHQDPPFRGCIAHQSRSDRLIFTALSWIK